MAKLGLKYPVYAIATDNGSTISYANGAVFAKATDANININVNNVKLPADDAIAESDISFSSGTVQIGIDDFSSQAKIDLLGYIAGSVIDATTGEKELTTKGSLSPYVGFGFYSWGKKSSNYWRAIWLVKVQFGEPSDAFKTKGESVEFQNHTVEGNILTASWDSTYWKEEARFSTEAACIAWLQGKAGLPVTASGGLTGLTMSGTGGSLSPAYGSAIRYYTFGGLTGTSFTITATAASHTLKLFENGTLLQNLTSGVASSAVSVSSIGTRKFVLVAQETGKSPITYEFIVVKTA